MVQSLHRHLGCKTLNCTREEHSKTVNNFQEKMQERVAESNLSNLECFWLLFCACNHISKELCEQHSEGNKSSDTGYAGDSVVNKRAAASIGIGSKPSIHVALTTTASSG